MSIIITKTRLGEKINKQGKKLVLITKSFNYNEDTWELIKSYLGLSKSYFHKKLMKQLYRFNPKYDPLVVRLPERIYRTMVMGEVRGYNIYAFRKDSNIKEIIDLNYWKETDGVGKDTIVSFGQKYDVVWFSRNHI